MSTLHFRRKPEVIRFNGQLINFAALCPNQVTESIIEYDNKKKEYDLCYNNFFICHKNTSIKMYILV